MRFQSLKERIENILKNLQHEQNLQGASSYRTQSEEQNPTPYLDKEGKVERRRKRRAYGSQGWKGWGGEIYFKKYGEIMMDVVDKKKARREAKKHIENELQDQL